MLRVNINPAIILLSSLTLFSCGGGGGGTETPTPPTPPAPPPAPAPAPVAATLTSPANNEQCNEGQAVSDSLSRVTFEWSNADNADSYTMTLTNLDTNVATEHDSTTNSISVDIALDTAYSWSVESKSSSSTETATSAVWQFYNAGAGVTNYAPFPAELVTPVMGSTIASSDALEWNGSDLDGDIQDYKVYMSTTSPPTDLHTTTSSNSVTNLTLSAASIYYWRVVTTDAQGNESQSPIFEFRTE